MASQPQPQPPAVDALAAYIEAHEAEHGAVAVPSKHWREWGAPVAPQAGSTRRLSAKVALGLGTPHTSPVRQAAAAAAAERQPQPLLPQQQQQQHDEEAEERQLVAPGYDHGQSVQQRRLPSPPRESRVVAAARIALASPSPGAVPAEVLLGAYRWQSRSAAAAAAAAAQQKQESSSPPHDPLDDLSWHSSVANLMDLPESPVSLGSSLSFSHANPLADCDASTEGEELMRDMTEMLGESAPSSAPLPSAPEEDLSALGSPIVATARRQRSVRRKRASKAAKAAALDSSDSVVEEPSARRVPPRRAEKAAGKSVSSKTAAQKAALARAAKIRAIVKEAGEERRAYLRSDAPLLRQPQDIASMPTATTPSAQPAADAAAAALPLEVPPAQIAVAAEEPQPRFPVDLLPLGSVSPVDDPQTRISQLDFYKMVGEFRVNQDDILRVGSRSSGEDYYIQQACAPDPYIERLVATVLALPRPQLEPPEPEPEPETEAEAVLPEAEMEELVAPEPEPEKEVPQVRPQEQPVQSGRQLFDENATATDRCDAEDKVVQAIRHPAAPPSAKRIPHVETQGKENAAPAGERLRQMAHKQRPPISGSKKSGSGARRCPPPSRKWAEQTCRDEQPQTIPEVELHISANTAAGESISCTGMTGVVERMPVGPEGPGSGRPQGATHETQRGHCIPRRKSLGNRSPAAAGVPTIKPVLDEMVPEMGSLVDDIAGSPTKHSDHVAGQPSNKPAVPQEEEEQVESPLSITSSSEKGASALISPAHRSTRNAFQEPEAAASPAEAADPACSSEEEPDWVDTAIDNPAGSFSRRLGAAEETWMAAMDSVSPMVSLTSSSRQMDDDIIHEAVDVGDSSGLLAANESSTSSIDAVTDSPIHVGSAPATWGSVPVGDQASPSASTLSPVSIQHLSGRSEAISVPSDPNDISASPPVKLVMDVSGAWKAALTQTDPPVKVDTMGSEPTAGTDLEALYAQHQKAAKAAAAPMQCCFELHQLGDDFVTGHHVTGHQQSGEAFYIRDGQISYSKGSSGSMAETSAVLSFVQVFPDQGECEWSACIEIKLDQQGLHNGSAPRLAVGLQKGQWARSGGKLGSEVQRGTFEAWRSQDDTLASAPAGSSPSKQAAPGEEGDLERSSDSLEQSALSSSSGGSSGGGGLDVSSGSETITQSMVDEAARLPGDDSGDLEMSDLSGVSMREVLAQLAKVKAKLVAGQS